MKNRLNNDSIGWWLVTCFKRHNRSFKGNAMYVSMCRMPGVYVVENIEVLVQQQSRNVIAI